MVSEILKELKLNANKEKAKNYARFFKTDKGQYGEGDEFLGVTVPDQRKIAKKFQAECTLNDILALLQNPLHEARLTTLLILVEKYKNSAEKQKEEIFNFYLKNTRYINNWDLVDTSCANIVGDFLLKRNREILYKLAISPNLWENRIAIVSTYAFIKNNELEDTFKLSVKLINHKHDLIHKACGWMLREAGKKDEKALVTFLKANSLKMPRTTIRYACEKLAIKF